MSARELEERLRVARGSVKSLQKTLRTRQKTLRWSRQRRDGFHDSCRIALAALDANPPSAGELRALPSRFLDSPQAVTDSSQANLRQAAQAEATLGAILLIIGLLCFAAAWLSSHLELAVFGYPVFVAGLNLLWNGLRQLSELRAPRCELVMPLAPTSW